MMKSLSLLAFALTAFGASLNRVQIASQGEVIPDTYIVQFHPEVPFHEVTAIASKNRATHAFNINNSFKAISAVLTKEEVEYLASRPDLVAHIEQDQIMRANAIQNGTTWGIDRIDQLTGQDTFYRYMDSAGEGVDVYVIDTGVRYTHNEFEGRVVGGYNFNDNNYNANDDNGHGTHCAGTIGGKLYGVAKKATIVPVKVLGRFGSGTNTGVINGVAYAASEHKKKVGAKSVASMSLGGGASTALDNAIISGLQSGVHYILAAGNENQDACNVSPARVAKSTDAITVQAMAINDIRSSFSNYGDCTTLYAPGSAITAAWFTSDSATNTISGTSMATPHVAGAAALLLGEYGNVSPKQLKENIISKSTSGVIKSHVGNASKNLMLYTLNYGATQM